MFELGLGEGIWFFLGAGFGEVPGGEEGGESEDDPEGPEAVFAGVAFDSGGGETGDFGAVGGVAEVGFAGVGEVGGGLEEECVSLVDGVEAGGVGSEEVGVGGDGGCGRWGGRFRRSRCSDQRG